MTERPTGTSDAEAVQRIWRDLRLLVFEQHDRRHTVAEELGMSFNRVKALRRIARYGPLTLRQLAARMVIDAPYATVIVDDLVRRGLAERVANPADRRSKLVHATPEGHSAAERAEKVLDTPPPTLTALGTADLRELERLTALLAAAPPPDPPA